MTTFVYGMDTPPQCEEEIYSSSSKEEISPAQRRGTVVRANMARNSTRGRAKSTSWDVANTEETISSARQEARQFSREAVLAYNSGSNLPHAPNGRAEQVIC